MLGGWSRAQRSVTKARRPTKGIGSRSETMIADTGCGRRQGVESSEPLGDRRLRNGRLCNYRFRAAPGSERATHSPARTAMAEAAVGIFMAVGLSMSRWLDVEEGGEE